MIYNHLLPLTALESCILLSVFLWVSRTHIGEVLSEVGKKTWAILALILASALILRLVIPPIQHIMYIDEPWYMEAAKNMLQSFSQGSYPKAIGWPFILAISFLLFGVSNWVAIYTAVVLGTLTILNVFLLTYIITKKKAVSLFSAVIFSLMPLHIRWSASAETNIPSLFFVTLTLFFCFLYYRKKIYSLLWLAISSMIFTALIRPDNWLLIPLFFLGCLIFKVKIPPKRIIFILFVLIVLISPSILQLRDWYGSINWLEADSVGQLKGSNWSLSNLIYNSLHFGSNIFSKAYLPSFILILSIIGFIYMLFKRRREACFLIVWFASFWIFFFSSWVQTIGGRDRFFMSFYPSIIIFAGYSLSLPLNLFFKMRLKPQWKNLFVFLLVSVFVILFFPYTLKAKSMYAASCLKLETKIPELAEKDIPSNAVIVANWPTILKSTTDLNVIDVNYFLRDNNFRNATFANTELLLFFEDYCCFDFIGCSQCKENCKAITRKFKLDPYKAYREGSKKYTFYKIIR